MLLTRAGGVTRSMPPTTEGAPPMVREARKQVRGLYLLRDQASRDTVSAWAALCPDRSVEVLRDRATGTLRVSIRRRRGRRAMGAMCLRDAMRWLGAALGR